MASETQQIEPRPGQVHWWPDRGAISRINEIIDNECGRFADVSVIGSDVSQAIEISAFSDARCIHPGGELVELKSIAFHRLAADEIEFHAILPNAKKYRDRDFTLYAVIHDEERPAPPPASALPQTTVGEENKRPIPDETGYRND